MPAAAYAGPRDLMERVAPAGDVYQAGTLSGNPLATAAGLATLRLLDQAAYERLDELTPHARRGPRGAAADAGVPVQVAWTTGLLTVFFSDGARARLRRAPSAATPNATARSAARCSSAASTCRPRSSRPGFPRWPTGSLTWSARSTRRAQLWRLCERCYAEIAAAADPALAPYARREPPEPRFGAELGERLFVMEAVYEGYLLHYGSPRLFEGMDEDLRLLAGDALYALGLARLARARRPSRGGRAGGADLGSAQAHAEGRGAERGGALGRSASGPCRARGSDRLRRAVVRAAPIVPLATMLALALARPQNH